ncbi:uncharacterized protein LOC112190082 [Rosa chinensis]|uniref:uncharacterized protein LOC112190082 n=1 Tax=Rosa chinensis TaxID=74649 RepID=UPI000D08CFB9|nr:uncharacterized protein LOC112190082 [Rosa chinensis]
MGGTCELAVNTISNIVAFGTVFDDADINKTIHGAPLKEGCVRVSVDGDIQGDAPLPFPIVGEMELVREAVGSHVAWPEEFVIQRQPVKKKKRNMDFVKSMFNKVELPPFVPKRCKLLYKHATTIMKQTSEAITTVLDDNVFGIHKELFILAENVIDLIEMKKIGQGVIAAYMVQLHELITERDELETFAFSDPAATYNCERSNFSSYLVNRLKEGKTDRIFFMPYNPGAIKSFNAETGSANKVSKLKLFPDVPKQSGGVECGYCVMRYMKDIINDDTLSFLTKWVAKTRQVYTQDELDEVRIEVADYLQTLL